MSPITQSATLGAATYRAIALAASLVLAALVLGDRAAAEQPTLKEVIGGPSKEGEVTEQPKREPEPKRAVPSGPDDEFDRGVPRTSVEGFLKAADERDYERAAQYLDLRNLPRGLNKRHGPKLARRLNIVFDRALWIDLHLLSTDPQGHADDGLPSYRDRLGQIKTPDRTFTILLQRVPRGDGISIWKFSSATVAEIPQLYQRFGYGYVGDVLSPIFFDVELFGIPAWLWASLLVLLILAYALALLATKIIVLFVRRAGGELSHQLTRVVTGPGRFLLFVLIGRAMISLLGLPLALRAVEEAGTLLMIAVAWMFMRLVDLFVHGVAQRLRRSGQTSAIILLPAMKNAAKILLIAIAALVWLDNLGFQVTTLLAGLGIGGLAVALAAQKSVENLIGAITLYASRPAQVGDFCQFGDTLGTVEEINLRSTRVRTLEDTVVSIPNAELVNLHIDNYTKREKIWYHPRIRLRYETTPDQIRSILVEVQKLLESHPRVIPESPRVRFEEFGEYSLNLDVFAYIAGTDYGEFLAIAEDLNLGIMNIVIRTGSSFAFPLREGSRV